MMAPIAEDQPQTENQLPLTPSCDTTALIQPKKYWMNSQLLQAVSACDQFFNCAYVKKQLEEEWLEESQNQPHSSSVNGLFMRMDKSVEVEIYRRFLFEENGLEPFEDLSPPDRRDGFVDPKDDNCEKRTG